MRVLIVAVHPVGFGGHPSALTPVAKISMIDG